MTLRILVSLGFILLIVGCAHVYVPNEYVIKEGRIPPFAVQGSVLVSPAEDPVQQMTIYLGAHHWDFTNHTIAQAISEQLMREVTKSGGEVGSPASKTFAISVNSFSVMQAMWTFNGLLGFSVTLGDGTMIPFSVPNNSPGNIWRTLNGNIARAVMEILSHPTVREYLDS